MFGILGLILVVILVAGISVATVKSGKQSANEEPVTPKKIFSLELIMEKLSQLVRRFPISLTLVVGLAILFVMALNGNWSDISYQWWIFFIVGTLFSISATLCAEDFLDELKTCGVTLLVVLLWGIYCILLPGEGKWDDGSNAGKIIEIFALGATAFFSMFFISFWKRNSDRSFWDFTTKTLFQLALACIFGGILFGGLALAFGSVNTLFGVELSGNLFGYLAIFCFVLFSPIYFLANIPNKAEKHSDEIEYNKVQKILALYIFTPILAVYAGILYVYLFKIIFTWELPNGLVSWLVSALALGGLLVITFLYPVREQGESKVVSFLSRWFGVIILPLLALMSIGIFRRIGDYGMTINRFYVLLLNLWFYGIYLYLFISKAKKIKWILISPVLLALVSSIGFWSVSNVTKSMLTSEVNHYLKGKQISVEEVNSLLAEMEEKERMKLESSLRYLGENYGEKGLQPFFSDTIGHAWHLLSDLGSSEQIQTVELRRKYFTIPESNDRVWKIKDFNTFAPINYYDYTDTKGYDKLQYSVENGLLEVKIVSEKRTFSIPLRAFILKNLEEGTVAYESVIQGEDYTFAIDALTGGYYERKDSIFIDEIKGYLFY